MIPLNLKPTERQLRLFGGVWLPLFLALLGGLWLWRHGSGWMSAAVAVSIVAIVSAVVGWIAPRAMRPVFVGLILITWPIGWVVSHVILAVIFFGVMTPLGWIMRLTGRDPMQRKLDPAATT